MITDERKLGYFTEAIAKEVDERKRKARSEMSAHFDKEVSQATEEAQAETNAQIGAQIQAIAKVMNKRITEATTESRRNLSNLRERLTAQLFDQVKADIIAFTKSPEYESFLIDNIKAAQASVGYSFSFIQLSHEDMSFAEAIQEATGLTPEPDDVNLIGGFKLLANNRAMVYEDTLWARLAEARQLFSEELAILQGG
ncbi:MAG: hypothetical protein FWE11_06345 [Defluviitaleaceae bacterium]|nr:hypothetical protein [Defluviitaleaceae bacterium]